MIVQTRDLTKLYGGHTALSAVDINVPDRCVYGLVGPNGAGKTTLLAILAGLRRPTSGEILLGVARHRMAVLPDTPQFDPWLTGREVVALAARLAAPGDTEERVEQTLRDAGLADAAQRRVGGYSRGMLQRLGIACTLVGEPSLLLLDEPASALDPAGRREVLDLIARLRGHATVIMSSHILADVQEVCDSVGILRDGRLLFEGRLDSLLVGRAVPAYRIHLRSGAESATEALRSQDWVIGVDPLTANRLHLNVRSLAEAEASLPAVLAGCGAHVISMAPEAADLEDVFLELTS
ncbi:ABC transporter ATP-binding protein [Rhizocola hellebori]|uniref:ABC transporter ATP-binding protein n=1 Tax=Rhizocola hellebori TaxID=1392758 RepID=A0A8J3VIY0_9ACTN|nr:ABC transporter ATP-binding protein [Rhizocola hellebori]GIH07872.1 ABC transporter ATP-binding protein [Rhizocola hellebori]